MICGNEGGRVDWEELWDRFVEVYFVFVELQSCCHLLWIYLLIIGFMSVYGTAIGRIGYLLCDILSLFVDFIKGYKDGIQQCRKKWS